MEEEKDQDLVTDQELCERLRISLSTLHRHLLEEKEYLKQIKCVKIGDSRRWIKSSVESFINQ